MSVFDLLYIVLLLVFSPLIAIKVLIDPQFRQNFRARLFPTPIPAEEGSSSKRIWVHAASIGEIRIAIKLINAWKDKDPHLSFFITTNTVQSKELGFKETEVPVCVGPFDLSWTINRFIKQSSPEHLILIETEIWPNLIRLMSKIGQTTIVNGRLSDRHFNQYISVKRLLLRTIARIDWVLARDDVSAERFGKLGVSSSRLFVQGNLKYEIPALPAEESLATIRSSCLAADTRFLFVAGSIQPEEVKPIISAWRNLHKDLTGFQMVLIPRHPDKQDEFARLLGQENVDFSFASKMQTAILPRKQDHILVIDQMGVLKSWYYLADTIFVGGSLCDRGGQNMVEAVGYKKPVCIGPYAANFKDEVDLLTGVKGLQIVQDSNELSAFIRLCHDQPQIATEMGESGYREIEIQAHSLDANVRKLSDIYSN